MILSLNVSILFCCNSSLIFKPSSDNFDYFIKFATKLSMADFPRKSNRLQIKARNKRAVNRGLEYNFSTEQDEEISNGQDRIIDNFELDSIIRKPTNNFLRVHNSYCTYDCGKYDGYDEDFIDDGESNGYSSQEDSTSDEIENRRSRILRFDSSSDAEMEQSDFQFNDSSIHTQTDSDISLLRTPCKDLVRGGKNGLKREKARCTISHSDEDIMTSARKQKISVLSSSTDSEIEATLDSPSLRTPSVRAINLQAKMSNNREEKFANFKANRLKSKRAIEEKSPPVSSIANFGLMEKTLREEARVLPSAHQKLSSMSPNRGLIGDNSDYSGDADEYETSYMEALNHTKQMVAEDEPIPTSSKIFNEPTQPLVFEFSDNTAFIEDTVMPVESLSIKQQLFSCFDSKTDNIKPKKISINTATQMDSEYDIDSYEYPAILSAYDITMEELIDFSPVELTNSISDYSKIPIDVCETIGIHSSNELGCSNLKTCKNLYENK
ncbi:hypothetical protein LOD99_14762 [Oopsacas minuta]|uniref:Uncharacterized protein n=1 Tax=Oopsacas minuta TaxID=111878 RepID=A0AAV7KDF7_9METZ|nr:hypothetical protein LOD99_14762 [Oopsacas minuta]